MALPPMLLFLTSACKYFTLFINSNYKLSSSSSPMSPTQVHQKLPANSQTCNGTSAEICKCPLLFKKCSMLVFSFLKSGWLDISSHICFSLIPGRYFPLSFRTWISPLATPILNTICWTFPSQTVSCNRACLPPGFAFILLTKRASSP